MAERCTLYRFNDVTKNVDTCHCGAHQKAQLIEDGWTENTDGKKALSDPGKKTGDGK